MNIEFNNICVKAISACLPKDKVNLLSYADVFGENEIKRITNSTGIKNIRVASTQSPSDLCLNAARSCLLAEGIEGSELDAIIFVSQTSDKKMPATSVIMQHKLGMSENAVAFDINYGCSGYVYGLYLASTLINGGGCKKVMLCAGDVITKHLDPKDQNVRLVFGDGGSATLIEKGAGIASFILKNDGSGCEHIKLDNSPNAHLFMDGAKVMEFVLTKIPEMIKDILSLRNWTMDEVGTYAMHQPNVFMLNYLRRKIGIPAEKLPIAVEGIGNTGPASIPIVLTENKDSLTQNNTLNKTILCGFGVGLSWAAAALDLSETTLVPCTEI